ncbi:MAG: hypothetical protein HY825_19800 [Acidobacteria bacterium]|nr:hypothetical protein [Acidobacteriota bacterium]
MLLGLARAEVRAWRGKDVAVRYVTDADGFVQAVRDFIGRGMTVAVGINPRRTTASKAASDSDVSAVQSIVFDVDPDNPAGTLATEEQVRRSLEFVKACLVPHLTGHGFAEPVVASSGNGHHVWLAIPPIKNEPTAGVKERLHAFRDELATALKPDLDRLGLRLDRTFDFSRLIKVYGTRKADLNGARLSRLLGDAERREDPALREHLLSLDVSTAPSSAEPATEPIDLGDYWTAPVPAEFSDLLSSDERLRKTWLGAREDMNDSTRSGHDLSLAAQLVHRARRDPRLASLGDPRSIAAVLWNAPYAKVKEVERDGKRREAVRYLRRIILKANASVVEAVPGATPSKAGSDAVAAPAGGNLGFEFPPLSYQVDHPRPATGGISATITVFKDGRQVHRDRVPLWDSRRRAEFARKSAEPDADAHLQEIERRLREMPSPEPGSTSAGSPSRSDVVLTEEQREKGTAFLRSPRLMEELDGDLEIAGLVGEKVLGRLLYLTATSRMQARPLHVLIMSESASGKSHAGDVVISLVPPEQVIDATSCSEQVLARAGSTFLKHKLVRLGEHHENEKTETVYYYVRELLSHQRTDRLVLVERDGRLVPEMVCAEGPIALIETTTKLRINHENATRMFTVRVDESLAQTRRIQIAQRRAWTSRQFEMRRLGREVIAKHQAAQRLLKSVTVVIPFAKHVRFPSLLRTRRDHERFLRLISASAFLHQFQRREIDRDGEHAIAATIDDYKIAYDIVRKVLADTLAEVPPASIDLHRALLEATSEPGKFNRDRFTVTSAAMALGPSFGLDTVRRRLRYLVQVGMVAVLDEGRGRQPDVFRVVKTELPEPQGIRTPEEVARRWAAARARARAKRAAR